MASTALSTTSARSRPRRSSGSSAGALDALFLQQRQELVGPVDREQSARHLRILAELRDLAEHRQILIRDLERRRDDQEDEVDRLLVDRLEVDALLLAPESHPELLNDEGATVRNRDPAADAGGPEVLAPLQHLVQHAFRLLVQLQKADQFLEDIVLRRARQVQLDGVLGKELA